MVSTIKADCPTASPIYQLRHHLRIVGRLSEAFLNLYYTMF